MSPFLRTLIFTILVPGFWTVVMPYWLVSRGAKPALGGVWAFGWFLIAVGIALYFACALWGFALRGKGTPAIFDPPKKLVEEGPYRIVRNPMYWSVALVMLGEGLVFHSLALAEVALAFIVGTNLFVLFYEEPHLKKVFGGQYEDYCRRVPRWFPRFKSKLD
jgi:protein-S-isoprenylcysteine O-methyltransferase Ste14